MAVEAPTEHGLYTHPLAIFFLQQTATKQMFTRFCIVLFPSYACPVARGEIDLDNP
jgi:hypothetical protein